MLILGVIDTVGIGVLLTLGVIEGVIVILGVTDGVFLGVLDGDKDGVIDGVELMLTLIDTLGVRLGDKLGLAVILGVGVVDKLMLGVEVGVRDTEGLTDIDGVTLGVSDTDGSGVGSPTGPIGAFVVPVSPPGVYTTATLSIYPVGSISTPKVEYPLFSFGNELALENFPGLDISFGSVKKFLSTGLVLSLFTSPNL